MEPQLSLLSSIIQPITSFSDGHYDYDIHGHGITMFHGYHTDQHFLEFNEQPLHQNAEYSISTFDLKTHKYLVLDTYNFTTQLPKDDYYHMCIEFTDSHLIFYSFSSSYLLKYLDQCPNQYVLLSFKLSPYGTPHLAGHRVLLVMDKKDKKMFLLDPNGTNTYERDFWRNWFDIYLDDLLSAYLLSMSNQWSYVPRNQLKFPTLNHLTAYNKEGWCVPITFFVAHLLSKLTLSELETILKDLTLDQLHPLMAEYIDGLYNKYVLSEV